MNQSRYAHWLIFKSTLLLFLMLLQLSGCRSMPQWYSQPIPMEDIPDLKMGMSLNELQDALQPVEPTHYHYKRINKKQLSSLDQTRLEFAQPLIHQFSIYRDEKESIFVSARIIDSVWFYFIIEDDHLVKILEHPHGIPVYMDVSEAVKRNKLWTDSFDQHINNIYQAPGLSPEQFKIKAHQQIEDTLKGVVAHSEPAPGLIVGTFISDLMTSDESIAREIRQRGVLKKQYNGMQIPLGIGYDQMQVMFGNPISEIPTQSGDSFVLYGPDQQNTDYSPILVVQYTNSKVSAVFGYVCLPQEYYKKDSINCRSQQ